MSKEKKEKSDIAENLGEIWNLNLQNVSEILNAQMTGEEKEKQRREELLLKEAPWKTLVLNEQFRGEAELRI